MSTQQPLAGVVLTHAHQRTLEGLIVRHTSEGCRRYHVKNSQKAPVGHHPLGVLRCAVVLYMMGELDGGQGVLRVSQVQSLTVRSEEAERRLPSRACPGTPGYGLIVTELAIPKGQVVHAALGSGTCPECLKDDIGDALACQDIAFHHSCL